MFLMLRSWRSLYGSARKSAHLKHPMEADAIFVDAISEVSVRYGLIQNFNSFKMAEKAIYCQVKLNDIWSQLFVVINK
jgi:hypothetical protein